MTQAPLNDRQFIQRSVRYLIIAAIVLLVVFGLLRVLHGVLTPLAISIVLAYLLDPVIDWFEYKQPEDRGRLGKYLPPFNRTTGIFLLALVLLAMLLLLLVGMPALAAQVRVLGQNIPGYIQTIRQTLAPIASQLPLEDLPHSLDEGLARLRELLQSVSAGSVKSLTNSAGAVFGNLVSVGMYFIIVPLITFYFLRDFDTLKMRVFDYVPKPQQERVKGYLIECDQLISAFIRGQMMIALILGVLYAVGLTLVGLDLAWLIGLIAGVGFIVPYLGTIIGVVLGTLMGLLQFGPTVQLLLIWGVFVVVQVLEGVIITPTIMGNTLKLHPVTVVLALIIGGELLGILGMLIAIPAAAVISVFWREFAAWYKQSDIWLGEA